MGSLPRERRVFSTIPFVDALRDLRMCSNLLGIGGQWWPSVRGGRESFDKIVDLTIRRLSSLQNHNPKPENLTSHDESLRNRNQSRFIDASAHFDVDPSQVFQDPFPQSNITTTDPISKLLPSGCIFYTLYLARLHYFIARQSEIRLHTKYVHG